MDQTLAQILNKLFELQLQAQQQAAEILQLRKVIASQLPVHEGSIADLQNGETVAVGSESSDQKNQ